MTASKTDVEAIARAARSRTSSTTAMDDDGWSLIGVVLYPAHCANTPLIRFDEYHRGGFNGIPERHVAINTNASTSVGRRGRS